MQIQGGNPATVFATTGSVNFQFAEAHSGSLAPSRFLWRWRDGSQYWSDGTWGSDDSFKDLNGSGGDPLVARWQWDEPSGVVAPATTGAEPFNDLTTAFFDGTNSRRMIVETMMVFDNGGEETELPGPPLDLDLSLNLPDFVIAGFSLDAGSGETTEWHTAQGGLPDFTLTIDTTSPVTQDVYLSLQRETTPLECGTLSSLGGNLFSLTESVNEQGNVRFILTADGTSGLATLLNGGTGVFTLKVGVDPCAAGQVPPPNRTVTITVNPSEGFLIRVHFRGHLGSSVISKAFSPVFDGSEAGQPMVLDLGDSPIHLYPRPTEHHHYDPFGQRIGNAGNEDDPRYTDHEFDTTTGFNYMKGRFQFPGRAKFNRPDPMRDWDWLNPQSLNLYQYVRNDPINGFDPNGFFWNELKNWLKGNGWFTDDQLDAANEHFQNGQEAYNGDVDETVTVNAMGQKMSRDQFRSDNQLVIARWKYNGLDFGGYEADAYKNGISLNYINEARERNSEWDFGHFPNIHYVTYDGHNTEIGRINYGKEITKSIAISIIIGRTTNLANLKIARNQIRTFDRSGSGLRPDAYHRMASFVTEQELKAGKIFRFRGGDGVKRTLFQTKTKGGIYEYIIDPKGTITHQRFIPGGRVTGFPNQN